MHTLRVPGRHALGHQWPVLSDVPLAVSIRIHPRRCICEGVGHPVGEARGEDKQQQWLGGQTKKKRAAVAFVGGHLQSFCQASPGGSLTIIEKTPQCSSFRGPPGPQLKWNWNYN